MKVHGVQRGVVVAVVALLLFGGACAADDGATGGGTTVTEPPPALATLAVIDTDVEVDGAKGSEGQALVVGNTVVTNPDGFGEVNYFDGSLTRVSQDAQFTIAALSDEEGRRQVATKLDGGTSWNRVAELGGTDGEYSVETPVATATATGTAFTVDCVALPASCTFAVAEGTIDVTSADGTVVALAMGERLTVVKDATEPAVAEVAGASAVFGDPWAAKNLAVDEQKGKIETPDGPPTPDDLATATYEGVYTFTYTIVESNEAASVVGTTNVVRNTIGTFCENGVCARQSIREGETEPDPVPEGRTTVRTAAGANRTSTTRWKVDCAVQETGEVSTPGGADHESVVTTTVNDATWVAGRWIVTSATDQIVDTVTINELGLADGCTLRDAMAEADGQVRVLTDQEVTRIGDPPG